MQAFAYIEFLEPEAVPNAVLLNDSELHGRQLKVRTVFLLLELAPAALVWLCLPFAAAGQVQSLPAAHFCALAAALADWGCRLHLQCMVWLLQQTVNVQAANW